MEKFLSRIDVMRNETGSTINLNFNQKEALGLGKYMVVIESSRVLKGKNAHGNFLIGEIKGDHNKFGLANTTPNGLCMKIDTKL